MEGSLRILVCFRIDMSSLGVANFEREEDCRYIITVRNRRSIVTELLA